jgi:putative nucleotidyltransferase with HDIG domain
MKLFSSRRPRAPRLLVKMLGVSFAVIAAVLAAVFMPLTWQASQRLEQATVENLEASQLRFAEFEQRDQATQLSHARTLAENPRLTAAIDSYHRNRTQGWAVDRLAATIQVELLKLQKVMNLPALSVTDARGVILASAGPRSSEWARGDRVRARMSETTEPSQAVVMRGGQAYLATVIPMVLLDDMIGEFFVATPLDDAYARKLGTEARTDVTILLDGRVVGASFAPALRAAVEEVALPANGRVELEGEDFVVRRLVAVGAAGIYALSSVSKALPTATTETALVLGGIGLGALLLAAIASWWLATTLASPIHDLTKSLAQMARERDFDRPVPTSGVSLELDALAETFDALRSAVAMAEAESEATYLGVIGALAEALDARDPYTAGHSDRVAHLSVAIGRHMQLPEHDIETIRLGALLHDIGKIGVSDSVLRKPGTLTVEEFDQIRRHPLLGARILKPLRFLADHLAIVELHHEQPDGRGYPYGLKGDQIPLLASIVRVADAFDAITTARAYRPARSATEAMAELWSHAGTGFDPHVVQAMAAIPEAITSRPPIDVEVDAQQRFSASGALVQFRSKSDVSARESAG